MDISTWKVAPNGLWQSLRERTPLLAVVASLAQSRRWGVCLGSGRSPRSSAVDGPLRGSHPSPRPEPDAMRFLRGEIALLTWQSTCYFRLTALQTPLAI